MNFINHSGEGSLDSGDTLECINAGINTVRAALRTLSCAARTTPTPEQIGTVLASLADWNEAAQALIDATEPDRGDLDIDDGHENDADDNCTGSGP